MRPLVIELWMGLTVASCAAEPVPSLAVRVYDYAGVAEKTLSDAELLAGHILRKAGIETEWIGCPKDREEADRYPACRKPTTPADLVLQIVPAAMEGYAVGQEAFGFALPSGDCMPARLAYVFYRRVENAARQSGKVSRATLLAYVMVHEAGHLLLGPGMHSTRGIMRPHWQPEELRDMETGRLMFSSDQARALQEAAETRVRRPCRARDDGAR